MEEFKTELHMHTMEVSPCGKISAKEAVRLYKSLGYHSLVITDHFSTRFFESLGNITWHEKVDAFLIGYRLAKDEGEKLGVRVILGMEYCIPGTRDDILIYGFDEKFLYDNENLYQHDEEELYHLAQQNDLLLIQAHPFRPSISKVYDQLVEGIEVYNGNPRHDSSNLKAEYYALQKRWIALSGSDFHREADAGTGGVYLRIIPGDSFALAKELRSTRTPKLIKNLNEKKKPLYAIMQRIRRFLEEKSG